IVDFNKQAGMSHGKISRVFTTLFGISITRGGSVHVVLRAARRAEPVYQEICTTVKAAPWVVPDETGWHVGGAKAWLHALDLRDRYLDGQLSRHGLDVCRGRLNTQLLDAIYPIKTNAANETLAQHLWNHRDDLLTFLKHPGLDATNWRAELAIRFGVILRK